MTRLPDWQNRLTRYLAGVAATPFEHGRHDCALFAAGAVLAMTGVDLAAEFRDRYATLTGGLRRMRRAGFADHVAYFTAHLPVRLGRARPGDLAVVDTPAGASVGVVQGQVIYVVGRDGLGLVPLAQAVTVFEVV